MFACVPNIHRFKKKSNILDFLVFADLQNVNITLRILFRPVVNELPKIYTNLGLDYDDRVLPSITNEVLKAVVVSGFERVGCCK